MMAQIAYRLALAASLSNLHFIQGDAHCLAMKPAVADLVASSLGFNATVPHRVFAEVHRILQPGGRFCFQEWGGLHPLDNVVANVLNSYALDDDDAPLHLLALRDFLDQDAPWYTQLQTTEDFVDLLSNLGFVDIDACEVAPLTLSLTIHEFIAYKMAWTARAAELAALAAPTRADCLDTLRARLYEHVDASGYLAYNPRLFRVRAIRV
jgi:SAM-dependent methyltransferase